MKKDNKQKKGISLIVLVITIVVMIILAAVIILSLDSSNIIERANEAKEATNLANLKEAASVALAEYKLEVSLGNLDGKTTSANDYVKTKLEEQGMDVSTMAVTADGKIMTGLTEVAAMFVGEGVEIGATVTGYTLSTETATKTVSTSGTENTAKDHTEVSPQPATGITRDESITWKYIGVDEEGKALIVGSITSSSPKLTLGGKGGYLNGVAALNTICKTMYSSDMGVARSINMDDVTNVLEYTGERGSYYNNEAEAKLITTEKPLTIAEIAEIYNMNLSNTSTPDGADRITYKSDDYYISKTTDVSEYNTARQNLIYPSSSTADLKDTYWIATLATRMDVMTSVTVFGIRFATSDNVTSDYLHVTMGSPKNYNYYIRPVVELASGVNISYNGTTVTLSK